MVQLSLAESITWYIKLKYLPIIILYINQHTNIEVKCQVWRGVAPAAMAKSVDHEKLASRSGLTLPTPYRSIFVTSRPAAINNFVLRMRIHEGSATFHSCLYTF